MGMRSKDDLHVRGRGADPTRGKGPISWVNLVATGGFATFVYGVYYFMNKDIEEKKKVQEKRTHGKAAIGGDFELVDQDGNRKTNKDFLGKWVLLYFGFTHCPDICPDEIEKMVEVSFHLISCGIESYF